METTYRVLRIDEQLYGCEELPAGQPVLCDVTLADPAGERRTLPYPDKELTRLGIDEGSMVVLTTDGTLKKAYFFAEAVRSSVNEPSLSFA